MNRGRRGTASGMAFKRYAVDLPAPDGARLQMAQLVRVLAHPTRRRMLKRLLADDLDAQGLVEYPSSVFGPVGAWTNTTRHLHQLRYAGWIHQRPGRTGLLTRLRRDDVEARFPGLIRLLGLVGPDAVSPRDLRGPRRGRPRPRGSGEAGA